jgi:hypothetical protein
MPGAVELSPPLPFFVNVSDPIGSGFVASLSRPGGNITGFLTFEFSIGGKWLELPKEACARELSKKSSGRVHPRFSYPACKNCSREMDRIADIPPHDGEPSCLHLP